MLCLARNLGWEVRPTQHTPRGTWPVRCCRPAKSRWPQEAGVPNHEQTQEENHGVSPLLSAGGPTTNKLTSQGPSERGSFSLLPWGMQRG